MIRLRSLYVLTGTLRVVGGETYKTRKQAPQGAGGAVEQITVVQDRKVTSSRRAANVIAASYMRRIRALRLLRTPYGVIIAPEKLGDLKRVLGEADGEVATFNAQANKGCELTNCLIWERLAGNRLAAVQGWIAARLERGDKEVKTVIPKLTEAVAAA